MLSCTRRARSRSCAGPRSPRPNAAEHVEHVVLHVDGARHALRALGSTDAGGWHGEHALGAHGHARVDSESDPLGSITRIGADAPTRENGGARTTTSGPRGRGGTIPDPSMRSCRRRVTWRSCAPDRRHPPKVAARARPLALRSRRPAAPPRGEARRMHGSALLRFFPRRNRGTWRRARRKTRSPRRFDGPGQPRTLAGGKIAVASRGVYWYR